MLFPRNDKKENSGSSSPKGVKRSSSCPTYFFEVPPERAGSPPRGSLSPISPLSSHSEDANRDTRKTYKIKFGNLAQNFNPNDLKNLRAQITISVGCSEKHSGEYFRATLEEALKTFGSVVIMIDDSVQWRTLAIGVENLEERTEDRLREKAKQNAENWWRENKAYIEEAQKAYPGKIEVIRWKDFDSVRVQQAVNEINTLYAEDPDFQRAIRITALDFLLRVKGYDFRFEDPSVFESSTENSLEPGVLYFYEKEGIPKCAVKSPNYEDLFELDLNLNSLGLESLEELSEIMARKGAEEKRLKKIILEKFSKKGYVRNKLGRLDSNGELIPSYCTNQEIMAMSESYLREECGVMAKIWTTHPKLMANVELYPAERTEAMKATYEHFIRKKYDFLFPETIGNRVLREGNDACNIELCCQNNKIYYRTKLSKEEASKLYEEKISREWNNLPEEKKTNEYRTEHAKNIQNKYFKNGIGWSELEKKDCVDILKMNKNYIPIFLNQLMSDINSKKFSELTEKEVDNIIKIISYKKHLSPSLLTATEISFQSIEKTIKEEIEQSYTEQEIPQLFYRK